MTRSDLLALPAAVDLLTAGRALSLGRSKAYELAQRGEFPVRLLRVGNSYRVPTADLLDLLGVRAEDVKGPIPTEPR
ncbi:MULTISPECIES: MerR family transcriptional regulator [Streptomyces]|uniref:helix-turn-helix domain-containing protein n=1 Tax=Streptomyces TaxID=1883 RepID=UPI000699BC15|nr:helix-turn-helix domain-containing protein [Streptomyces sp. SID7805]MYU51302.1 helix-turn-helix domain-containing protein [Streptomyces sp. SID7805]WSK14041.1 helix-turn-helix domain-containing protein [Streptomyces celluloflavus]